MRSPTYDRSARKRTVSLTLNGDLYVKAKAQGINMSKVAEVALALGLKQKVEAEIERDLVAYNAYVAKHGSPAEMLRDHLADRDNAA